MAKEASRKLIKSLLPLYHRLLARFIPGGDRAFFDPAEVPWTAGLERDWRAIRAELDAVLEDRDALPALHEVEPGQDDIADERWKAFVLKIYGREVPENCARCPGTMALLRPIPEITTAMFSILGPGTHVPPHRGPFKGVLRCQLALLVPNGADRCEIRVGDELRGWVEGRAMVFDDTFEHEVWNETGAQRVVLFLDFLRPLPASLARLNRALMGVARFLPAVRRTQRNARRMARASAR